MEEWFKLSLISKHPGPTSAGIVNEFVAKPIPKVSAASTPRNSATSASNSKCLSVVPTEYGTVHEVSPHFKSAPTATGGSLVRGTPVLHYSET